VAWWQFAAKKGRERGAAGIDLSPSGAKGVMLRGRSQRPMVAAAAVVPFEPQWYGTAGIAQPAAVAKALAALCQQLGRVQAITLALPDAAVIQRTVDLPAGLSEREEEELVFDELARMSPFPVEELQADWCRIGPGRTPESERWMIVAARQERVEALQLVAETAGVHLVHVDVASLALRRAVWRVGLLEGSVVVVDGGDEAIELTLWQQGEKRFERTQGFEANRLLRDLTRLLRDSAAAQRVLAEGRWDETARSQVLQPFLTKFAFEVANLIKVLQSAVDGLPTIDRIVLTGGIAALPGVVDAVQSMVTPPVVCCDPWRGATLSDAVRPLAPLGTRFALATGLAWREVG